MPAKLALGIVFSLVHLCVCLCVYVITEKLLVRNLI